MEDNADATDDGDKPGSPQRLRKRRLHNDWAEIAIVVMPPQHSARIYPRIPVAGAILTLPPKAGTTSARCHCEKQSDAAISSVQARMDGACHGGMLCKVPKSGY
jgi:hypothetical protein